MPQKTVAIAINTSWNIYNFRLGLIDALQEAGYHVVAVAPRDVYTEKIERHGIDYHAIEMHNKGTNPFEDLKLIYDFWKRYKEIDADVILHYTIKPNIYGSIAAWMLGIPVINNISGLGTVFLREGFSSKIARLLYRIALKIPKKVFFQNRYDRNLFIEKGLVAAQKSDLLPGSGIDTHKFKPRSQNCKHKKVIRFLFIGRLLKDKGLEEFVYAAKKVSSHVAKFYVLGEYYPGNPTAITPKTMHQWEEEHTIEYIGASDDVASVLAQYDCIVLPSYREGLSRVLLEAASMEKPIITTNVPGCREVVEHGVNGYLCKPRDIDSLAEQMENMIHLSQEKCREMGKRGREKVMHEFEEKLVIDKYREAILEAMQ